MTAQAIRPKNRSVHAGFFFATILLVLVGLFSIYNVHRIEDLIRARGNWRETKFHTESLVSSIKDAESGQRGYLLTHKKEYLEPYEEAITVIAFKLSALEQFIHTEHRQAEDLIRLKTQIANKLQELDETIRFENDSQHLTALALLKRDIGKIYMDEIRKTTREMLEDQDAHIAKLTGELEAVGLQNRIGVISGSLASLLIMLFAYRVLRKNIRELNRARNDATQAGKAKSDFLANMSHEIRTPMNGVVATADLLTKTSLSGKQKELVETIRASSESLLAIINDILDFSKIDSGTLRFHLADLNLRDLVESALEVVSHVAHQKRLQLVYCIDPNVPLNLTADEGRVRQILINLLNNALKFTEKGSVSLTVSLDPRSQGTSPILHFRVKDTGIGMSEENIPKLFSAFTQVHEKNIGRYGGTGLGLAISHELIKQMKGEIHVESKIGEGSTFHFHIELQEQADRKTQKYPEIRESRILVFEPNPVHLNHLTNLLSSWDIKIEQCDTLDQSLPILLDARDRPYQFALLHINQLDQALSYIKRLETSPHFAATRIIFMTLHPMEIEFRKLGPCSELVMPFRHSQLLDAFMNSFPDGPEFCPVNYEAPSVRPFKILVAEDNKANRRIALLQLEELGYQADAVENGRLAYEAVKKGSYHLVLMDCQMPEMDGFQATQLIRKELLNLPIIAMTANALTGDRELCLESGMNDYISKPTKLEALKSMLEKWLNKVAKQSV